MALAFKRGVWMAIMPALGWHHEMPCSFTTLEMPTLVNLIWKKLGDGIFLQQLKLDRQRCFILHSIHTWPSQFSPTSQVHWNSYLKSFSLALAPHLSSLFFSFEVAIFRLYLSIHLSLRHCPLLKWQVWLAVQSADVRAGWQGGCPTVSRLFAPFAQLS